MAILVPKKSDGLLVQELAWAHGVIGTLGVSNMVDAPGAGKRIVARTIAVQNESATATVVQLKDGTDARLRAKLKEGASLEFASDEGDEWRLSENAALVMELDGAFDHSYSVRYFIEDI